MIQNIKNAIKANLDALVTDQVLGGATITDIKKNPLDADIPSYPHAFLMPPGVESEVLDNRTNIRTYTFGIMVLFNAENLASTTELEEMVEAMSPKPEPPKNPSGRPRNAYDDLFSQMFETGRQTREEYEKAMKGIFERRPDSSGSG